MHHAVFTVIDANHHTEDWTYMTPGDKPVSRATWIYSVQNNGRISLAKGYLENRMDREWNDSQPIYRQLRDRVVGDDTRWRAQRRRCTAIGAQRRGRIPSQSAHGSEGLSANWWTRGLSRASEVSACSSMPVHAICFCKANARGSLPKNGPGSTLRFSGSVSRRKNCSTVRQDAGRGRK